MSSGATPTQVPSMPTQPTAATKRKAKQPPAFVSPQRHSSKRTRSSNEARTSPPSKLVVTKELIALFIELDKLEEIFLKKAISIVRQKLEDAGIGTRTEVEVIDVINNGEEIKQKNEETNVVNDIVGGVIETGTVSTHHPITTDHQ